MKLTYNRNKIIAAVAILAQGMAQHYMSKDLADLVAVVITTALAGVSLKAQTLDKAGDKLEKGGEIDEREEPGV